MPEALFVGQAEESAAAKLGKTIFGFAKRGKLTVRIVNRGAQRKCINMRIKLDQ